MDQMIDNPIPSRNRTGNPAKPLRVLGICLGASTVSMVQASSMPGDSGVSLSNAVFDVQDQTTLVHEGDPKRTLLNALKDLDLSAFDKIAATGRRFRKFVNLTSIPEPAAVEWAYRFVKPADLNCPAIVSAGGETFMAYLLDRTGHISNVLTGNKCASGTGEFFLQQLRRMDVPIEEAALWAAVEQPYHVSGRCSVFCKSDCTHATNKGIPKQNVTAGLCKMMSDKILELVSRVEKRHIMVTGGTVGNQMMVSYLKNEIPDLIIPEYASCFEALGAALWAVENDTRPWPGRSNLFFADAATFDRLPALKAYQNRVSFKTMEKSEARPGDTCILGLDVGSTTTKAVLLRLSDHAMVGDIYLRTNGDPVNASRRCYRRIIDQVQKNTKLSEISIIGLGICGSGRQIAGLHALTDGVINEIIAHSAAAVYFDPKVDTIFEIGGQDAKYTYIKNAVPADYAMNEACSAGTGSFLEESAFETLGIQMEDIAEISLKGSAPPNFNDQCAAFIASDIKNAIHEGVARENIVAGLVYSICMNYSNRVKGNRPVGEKVFMQGGVCYNRAVPLAMAALVGKPIVVPPEPGLMGAFGVALEIEKRIASGLMHKTAFDLQELADREVVYGKSFECSGGREKCDRRCKIRMIQVDGKKHPFGGACNRYYNLRRKIRVDVARLDLVRKRQTLIFNKYGVKPVSNPRDNNKKSIGINRSFLVNTYYPLYSSFFDALGYSLVVPDHPSREGIDRRGAPFCYPVELAHGFFHTLLTMEDAPEYLFLPHFKSVPLSDGSQRSEVCPLVQGETYYLQTAFKKELDHLRNRGTKLLAPLLDLNGGLDAAKNPLLETAAKMGIGTRVAKAAFTKALSRQRKCLDRMQAMGKEAIAELEKDPGQMAVVLFGRPYNAFVEEAHMGIPRKLASRGVAVIPIDLLPIAGEHAKRHMYWGLGQTIIMAARYVKSHPQLFGTYITNFSCGPDSFVITYFRDIMGRKPSLTLELDSHTADAGLETRIEAFLDVVSAYRNLTKTRPASEPKTGFQPARTVLNNGHPAVVTSAGKTLPMTDPRVTVLFPSMGRIGSEMLAALFGGYGFNTVAHPPADETILKIGRANTSCKECLPLILTTGTLLNYIQNGMRPDEILIYFMLTGAGPCRFGQYAVFMEDLIKNRRLPDVALFSLSSEDGYSGLNREFHKRAFWAIVISDLLEDIRSVILTNAVDKEAGLALFENQRKQIMAEIEIQGNVDAGGFYRLEKTLTRTAKALAGIPMKRPLNETPIVSLVGEIFVRRDGLSRQYITERLADKGFATVCAPVAEWLSYADWLVDTGINNGHKTLRDKIAIKLKRRATSKYGKKINALLAPSGLILGNTVNVPAIIDKATPYISPNHCGEAILTVGSAISEIASHSCGVIAIGPFGCMPNRMSEAILSEAMNRDAKLASEPGNPDLVEVLAGEQDLPFLAIESDGSPFPQLISAKLEAFCLRAERLHSKMLQTHGPKIRKK